jgi:predicted NUDIX family NTP pyrophosphohydrolase
MEWPPRSGRAAEVPEVDRAAFFAIDEAIERINPRQADLVRQVLARVGHTPARVRPAD